MISAPLCREHDWVQWKLSPARANEWAYRECKICRRIQSTRHPATVKQAIADANRAGGITGNTVLTETNSGIAVSISPSTLAQLQWDVRPGALVTERETQEMMQEMISGKNNPYSRHINNLPRTPMESKIEVTTVTYVTAPGIGARVDVSTLNADQLARGVEEIQFQIDRLAKVPGSSKLVRARIRELENGLIKLVSASNAAYDVKTNGEEEPERAGGTD